MDEKQLRALSVLGTLACLAVLYLMMSFVEASYVPLCDIGSEHKGKLVSVKGYAKDMLHAEGNVFFTLYDGGCEIDVVLWRSVVSALEMNDINISEIKENVSIRLSGEVQVYRGLYQIVPLRPDVYVEELR